MISSRLGDLCTTSAATQSAGAWHEIHAEVDLVRLEQYRHVPLPTTHSIRLLLITEQTVEILPYWTKQQVCTLETFSLGECPPYFALSYTWGPPVNSEGCIKEYAEGKEWVLESEGELRRIGVTKNLYYGLQRIIKAKSSVKHIWIDALCICQTDLAERASQVAIMTEIFARCERVIVWLGEGGLMAPGLTDFYMLHSTILPPLREYIKAHGTESLSWGDWDEDTFYKRLALENICERLDWKGYRRFYRERNWFERAWVFQEVAFVPEVVVLCGNYTFSLDDLGMLADCLRLSGLATTTMIARFDGSSIFRLPGMEVNAFHRLRKTCSGIGSETWLAYWAGLINIINLECTSYMFFLYCIRQLRHSQATDPRDKIFAAYGFLKKCLPAGITPRIQPDYTLPVEDVYTMTAATLLQVLPELSLLSEVEDLSLRRLERLPSWVPDFSAPEAQSLLGSDRRDRYNASLCPSTAIGPLNSAFVMVEGSRLTLCGARLDSVTSVQPPVTKITSDLTATGALEHTSEHIVSWFNVISDLTARGEPGLETVWEVLWRTLIANKVNEPGCAVVTRETFHDFILQWFITCATILRDEELNPTLEAWAADNACLPTEDTLQGYAARARAVRDSLYLSSEDLDSLAKVERNRATFAEAISRSALHRRLFVTEYGRLGLGPQSMQPSDQVWLICGARMLFVLRPTSDEGCFTLVGETYVHGCMNGEVVDMFEDRMGAVTLI